MKTRENLHKEVTAVLVREFELDENLVVPEATLYGDLGLDSLDAVDMVVVLEKEFGVKLGDENALRSLQTVEDLLDFMGKVEKI